MSATTTPGPRWIDEVEQHEEREATAIRKQLGLRPVHYPERPGGHPDQRPCPSWCWVGQSHGEYEHEIDPRDPMRALHDVGSDAHVVASLYAGRPARGDGDRWAETATIEAGMEQRGQGEPVIRVCVRHYADGEHHYDEALRLSVTDAQELAAVLAHLVRVADGDA